MYGPYDDETHQEEWDGDDAYQDQEEEGYDDEAYERLRRRMTYEQEGYDNEAWEQEEGYDDEAYDEQEGYDNEAYDEQEEGYDDTKAYEDEAYEGYADETCKKEIGTAMMPTKIKNKNGVAMKPKTMQKIHANMGNAYSLLVQKAAGGVTCANIGTIATQIRVNHSRHQAEIGNGTAGLADANRYKKLTHKKLTYKKNIQD